ncbi:coproporphyrinogen III oxidase [Caviibacter abscessus]|uniref:coproporphyrinogen III oxidase n=1 Tax=Caviibacter abscessus TaxID=1766719 RepID=UPI00082B56FF|nr:coproporphyrinogen III oxidase [Caviibacter abscessus]
MKIKSNKDISENKLKEFIYSIFPDNNDEIEINFKENKNNIEIEYNKEYTFSLPVLYNREKQKLAMLKTGLLKLYNKNMLWGGIVGVRPTKLFFALLKEVKSFEKVCEILKKVYLVSDEKTKLLENVARNSIEYIDETSVGVYIGIAFCPTKCSYCSFPAYLKKGKYELNYSKYIDTLIDEVTKIGKLLSKLNLKLSTIYIGGGTPSILNVTELRRLLDAIIKNYNLQHLIEFTFEAGRIDTLDDEKLEILKHYNVDRISINPQSFKDETLKLVNRYHNIEKLNDVYNKAKELGFIINMDYILGLPKESTQDILNTIQKMYEYDVENITIHNLALKKSSYLTKTKFFHETLDYKKIYEKIFEMAKSKKYVPYYMYRQKNSYDWGENIGFCKKGYQSVYNIDMIEENKNIFGIGAGSVTKLIDKNTIKRISSPKDPLSYILEYDKRLNQKIDEILEYYEKFE